MQASDLSESSLLAYTAVPAMAGAPNGQVVRWGCHGVLLQSLQWQVLLMVKLCAGAAMVFFFFFFVYAALYVLMQKAWTKASKGKTKGSTQPVFCTTACMFAQICCCRHRLHRLACLHSDKFSSSSCQLRAQARSFR